MDEQQEKGYDGGLRGLSVSVDRSMGMMMSLCMDGGWLG